MKPAICFLLLSWMLCPSAANAEPMDMHFVVGPQTGTTFAISQNRGLVVPEFGLRTGLIGFRDDHLGDMMMHVGLGSPRAFLFDHCGEPGYGFVLSFDALFGFNVGGGVYLGYFTSIGYKPMHVGCEDARWLHNLVTEFGIAVLIPLSDNWSIAAHFDFLWTPPLGAETPLSPISTALKLEMLFTFL